MRAKQIATAVIVLGAALACPAGADALTFARTDYPLPNLTAPVRTSDVGPASYDDSPVALVDLNKDGKLDIAIADYGTGRVDVLLNQGGGSFAAAAGSPYPACTSDLEAHDVVAGQLNPQTDQNPDVAVICDTDGSITRLLGDGSGSLGAPQAHGFGVGSGGIGTPLRVGHVSGTSGGDYLYGNQQAYMCILSITDFATAGAETCDFQDASLPGSGAASATGLTPVHWYDGPCFAGDEIVSFSRASYGAFLGSDLDPRTGPGGPGANSCTVPFQSSDDRNSGIAPANVGTAIRAGDLNRDGEPDVVIADNGGSFHVTAWQGASANFAGGIPPTAQPSNFGSAGPISSLGIGDLNGDGCPDIAAADVLPSSLQYTVAVHAGHCNATQFDPAQTFDVAGDSNTNSGSPKMAMGDLNGDGRPDLVTTGGYAGFATVLLNTTPAPVGGGGGGPAGGGGGGTGGSPFVVAALGSPKISPTAFPAAPSGASVVAARKRTFGAKVTYTLNEAAGVRFVVVQSAAGRRGKRRACVKPTRKNRRAHKCTRLVTLRGSITLTGHAGPNSFRFTGRLAGRKLKPGKYRLVGTPSAGGRAGRPAGAAFRIIK
jgi:hypothetical protein